MNNQEICLQIDNQIKELNQKITIYCPGNQQTGICLRMYYNLWFNVARKKNLCKNL